ncbi:hypothetical protein Daesc_006372 [Daldinia eschscholtzii]|uniref:Cytochrome P450 n=1 Tax=Daldinia eschscholtzii TaxID=292717 RepID=A0AAX6MHF0_9PEZI
MTVTEGRKSPPGAVKGADKSGDQFWAESPQSPGTLVESSRVESNLIESCPGGLSCKSFLAREGYGYGNWSQVTGHRVTGYRIRISESREEYLEELRVEIASVTVRHGKGPDKQALASMVKLDSSMREPQRVNTLVIFSVPHRKVKNRDIKTPSGIHIPRGAVIVVPAYSIMHPYTFKPFRFAGDAATPDQGSNKSHAEELVTLASLSPQRKRQGWTQATPEYTSFRYGPHACPGRSIAAVVVKLMMAYIIAHYDFEVQENVILGASLMTPQKATIRARRRKEEDIGFAW